MKFSPQQAQAIKQVTKWLQDDTSQLMRLFGYAGTGKTTLARHLEADFYAAFTGKAASVLRSKGCPASTIHQLIYLPRQRSLERLTKLLELQAKEPYNVELAKRIQLERENLKKPSFILNLDSPLREARLLVIDECSMVNEQIGKDLLSFGCKVLVLGDPAQLPPVYGGGYFTDAKPDFMLTEIHRQARENPILDLATRVREQGVLPKHPLVVEKVEPETVLAMDQIIVGRNSTRKSSNARIRDLLGFHDPMPEPGERLVCLRNNHVIGILNGATYRVLESQDGMLGIELRLLEEGTEQEFELEAHRGPFLGQEVPDDWSARERETFDFGYALTCHKSQGSQWPGVGVVDESASFRHTSAKWLYTAITRASEKLWVLRRD